MGFVFIGLPRPCPMPGEIRIGQGTCLITCHFCGKSMLDGALIEHWQSGECRRLAKERTLEETIRDLRQRVSSLEHPKQKKKDGKD